MFRALKLTAAIGTTVLAADQPNTFSKFSGALTASRSNAEDSTSVFLGHATLVGTLYVEFDMESSGRANGQVNFAKFVPDRSYAGILPAVVGGAYPGPVNHVNLKPADVAFVAAFGEKTAADLARGTKHVVSARVQVSLSNFNTAIECDSRVYFASIKSTDIDRINLVASSQDSVLHGC